MVCYDFVMANINWIFRNGVHDIDCTSFPNAFRTMYTIVKKSIVDKKPINTKNLSILGPKNSRGERKPYSYDAASKLATEQGLLTIDGQINSREFKKR